MLIKQFLPKALRIPDVTFYDLKGVSYDMAKSYLVTLPVTDRIIGIEIWIDKDSIRPYFFIEAYKTELPLKQIITGEYLYPNLKLMSCYNFHTYKSSVFPFQANLQYLWGNLQKALNVNESIMMQFLLIKKTSEKLKDQLWTAYEDYVNGIEYPTNNKPIRYVQQGLLEMARKLEGGYKRNPRIPESEKKIEEDHFSFEGRMVVYCEDVKRKSIIIDRVDMTFSAFTFVNQWLISEDVRRRGFIENIQLKRPSLFYPSTIVTPSEIASLFITESEAVRVITKVDTQLIPTEQTDIEVVDNNPFSIFPIGEKKKKQDDIYLAQNLNQALRKLSLISDQDVIIQKIQHGSTVQKITFTLPVGLKLSDLTRAKNNIQTELALNGISIEQGSSAGTVALTIPQEERDMVFLRECAESEIFQEYAKKADLPFILGVSTTGDVIVEDLVRIKHLLIAGTTGSGKSVFLNSLLTVLLALVNPLDMQMIMIDPKMVELKPFKDYMHVQNVYTDMNEAEGVLCYLCDKMDERYGIFEKKGYKNVQQHNRNESVKLPYIVLIVEELADLMSTNPEVEIYLERLAQKARAAGIHLILCTQYPIKEVVTSLIKRNIYSRICFALDSGTAYKVALDEVPNFTLLGKGDGVYRLEGIQGLHRFQGAVIAKTEEEQDVIIKKLSGYWKENVKKDVIDIESARQKRKKAELDQFKKIVLETSETRITELQKVLNVGNGKVKELMDELVALGWVKQHKSRAKGYELLLSPEERKKHLQDIK